MRRSRSPCTTRAQPDARLAHQLFAHIFPCLFLQGPPLTATKATRQELLQQRQQQPLAVQVAAPGEEVGGAARRPAKAPLFLSFSAAAFATGAFLVPTNVRNDFVLIIALNGSACAAASPQGWLLPRTALLWKFPHLCKCLPSLRVPAQRARAQY